MNYSTGYSVNCKEILSNFPLNKLKTTNKQLPKRRDELLISVFLYGVKIILEDIFTNGNRFRLPTGKRVSFIEMKLISGDDFIKARRNKKFKNIDFYRTDYTAYYPIFTYYGSNMKKEKEIYVSNYLKKIIEIKTNEGFNFFNKDTTINDYIDDVHKEFSDFHKSDIKRILSYGWKMLCLYNVYGCDTLIKDDVNLKYLFYIGKLRNDSLQHHRYSVIKHSFKLRLFYKLNKIKFDGYCYFGLTKNRALEFTEVNKKKKIFQLKDIYMFKILDECKHHSFDFIFKVKYNIDKKYKIYKEEYETRNIELIYRRNGDGYESINNSKQYINKLLKRYINNI